jgi:hypothetical protein
MLGEMIDELVGKITGIRVIEGARVESSFAGHGKILGVDAKEMGTYTSTMTPAGVLNGEGHGLAMSAEGDALSWRGHGIGRLTDKGGQSFRYSLVIQTASSKWARLNSVLAIGEWEVDAEGNGHGKLWEWR